jgi:large subunit ribosomal protein L21
MVNFVYAVIRTGSKQYRVEPGKELLVEKLNVEPGQSVEISDVLLFGEGENVTVGTPVAKASVVCTCIGHEKGPKLRTIKYRRRKNYKRTYGHRQTYTRLSIEKIEAR